MDSVKTTNTMTWGQCDPGDPNIYNNPDVLPTCIQTTKQIASKIFEYLMFKHEYQKHQLDLLT